MATDRLIDSLAADLSPVRRRSARRDGLWLAGLAAVELALTLSMGLVRPDMHHAMSLMTFWWKLTGAGLVALLAVVTAVRSFDPAASPRRGLRALCWVAAIALLVGWVIDASHDGKASLADRLDWWAGTHCLAAMLMLALPMLAMLMLLMRRGAPTDRRGSGLAAGLGAAAWGAFVFLFSCPHDDPLYVVAWYGSGCVLMALAGRWLMPRLSRW